MIDLLQQLSQFRSKMIEQGKSLPLLLFCTLLTATFLVLPIYGIHAHSEKLVVVSLGATLIVFSAVFSRSFFLFRRFYPRSHSRT